MLSRHFGLLLILALVVVPTVAGAQGFLSSMIPGLFGRVGCGPLEAGISPELYFGWMDSERCLRFGLETDNPGPPPVDVYSYDLKIPTRGAWFGCSASVPVNRSVVLVGRAWYHIPSEYSGDGHIVLAQPVRESQESVDTNWWHIDAMAAYSPFSGVSILAGLRYELYQQTLTGREWEGLPPTLDEAGRSDLDFTNWFPFIGLASSIETYSANLSASVIVSPVICEVEGKMGFTSSTGPTWGPGVVRVYDTVTDGYFFEFMAEYSTKMMFGAEVGAFARFSALHGTTDDLKFTWNGAGWAPGRVEHYQMSLNRTAWTIGCKAIVDLDWWSFLPL